MNPGHEHFPKRFCINFIRANKFSLDNVYGVIIIVYNNCINLFIIGSVSYVHLSFIFILKVYITKVPSYKSLSIVWKVLLIIVFGNIESDFIVHGSPSFRPIITLVSFR